VTLKIILTSVLVVTIYGCYPIGVAAQTFSEIREKAVGMVEAKYPERETTHLEMTLKRVEENQAFYNWQITQNGKQRWIVIKIFYGKNQDETAKFMEVSNGNIPTGPGRKRANLGDEAYYSENLRVDFARLRFRKANVYFDIQATTIKEAEEIAKGFDKLIKKK